MGYIKQYFCPIKKNTLYNNSNRMSCMYTILWLSCTMKLLLGSMKVYNYLGSVSPSFLKKSPHQKFRYKPSLEQWKASCKRRNILVNRIARSFGTHKQTFCYFYRRINQFQSNFSYDLQSLGQKRTYTYHREL